MAEERVRARRYVGDEHPVNEVLPPASLVAYGLQHVLAMYAGIIAVPIILATAIGLSGEQLVYIINASFLCCGIATLVQTIGFWKVGVRLPIIMGTTFAAATPMIQIGDTYSLQAIYGAVIVAGIFTFLAAPYFSYLIRFFPPVVTGTVIAIIGISLMPVAINWSAGGVGAEDYASPVNIATAFAVLLFILAVSRFLGGFWGRISIMLGLVVGTAAAAAFGMASFETVGDAAWVGVTTPFAFGAPEFYAVAIFSMILVMLVVMIEATADTIAIGEITGRDIDRSRLARALRADGFGTTIGGLLNAFPFATFSQNVGLVRFTNVKSRFVVATSGAILILLGLFPKLGALVASIPLPVLGGAGLVLFGTVAAVGIQVLSRVDFNDNRNMLIVAIAFGLGLIPAVVPDFYDGFPEAAQVVLGSGITAAAIGALLLNLFLNVLGGRPQESALGDLARGMSGGISLMQVNNMSRERFVERFAPIFQGVRWVPERAWEERPFGSLYDLRHAFQSAIFNAPPELQKELIRAYPDLAGGAGANGTLPPLSARDQAAAGLDRLSDEEHEDFDRLNAEYREKFDMPLVVCVREHTKESILASGRDRLENSPDHEHATALVEIAKIANVRLQEAIEGPEGH
jgi:uric acid transporter